MSARRAVPSGENEPSQSREAAFNAKKRRALSRSDEDIVREIHTVDSIRFTVPRMPTLPLHSTKPDAALSKFLEQSDTPIRAALQANHLELSAIRFEHRTQGDQSITKGNLTLVVIIPDNHRGNILGALTELSKLMVTVDVLNVEMLPQFAFPDKIPHPILGHETHIIEEWSRLQPEFLSILSNPKAKWTSLNVFRFGLTFDPSDCPPTIILKAENPDDLIWDSLTAKFHALLRPKFAFALRYGKPLHLIAGSDDPPDNVLELADLTRDRVHWGSSVGPSSSPNECGTLGGLMIIKDPKKAEHLVGLTNCHVIAHHPELLSAAPNRKEDIPIIPNQYKQTLKMVSPSNIDICKQVEVVDKSIAMWTKPLQAANDVLRKDEEGEEFQKPSEVATARQKRDQAQQMISSYQLQQQEFSSSQRDIGYVMAASGKRLRELKWGKDQASFALDWALIKIDDQHLKGRKDLKYNYLEQFPTGQPINKAFPAINEASKATYWRPYKPGEDVRVCKRGRTTKWTHGTISAIHALCPAGPIMNKELGAYPNKVVSCIPLANFNREPVVASGDSGSIVLARSEDRTQMKWIGLLFLADVDGDCGTLNLGYMTPIQHIFADIEKVTGGEIVFPKRED